MKVGLTERKRSEEVNTGNVPGSMHADINISKRSGVVGMFDVNQYFLRSLENSKLLNRELYFREIKCPFKAKEQFNFKFVLRTSLWPYCEWRSGQNSHSEGKMTQREWLSLILGNSIHTEAGYIRKTSSFTYIIKLSKHLDENAIPIMCRGCYGHFTLFWLWDSAIFSLDTTQKMQGREAEAVAALELCKRKRLGFHMKPTYRTQPVHSCASI